MGRLAQTEGLSEIQSEILAAVQGLGPADLVLFLVSGGGSSLSTLPAPGLTLDDLKFLFAGG